jgi:Xaa-Pro dipeptidase
MRGAVPTGTDLLQHAVREIKGRLADAGVAGMPIGVDVVRPGD